MTIDLKIINDTLKKILNEFKNKKLLLSSKPIGGTKKFCYFLSCGTDRISSLYNTKFSLDIEFNESFLSHRYYINLNSSNKKEIINYLISLYE